jgi:hypothetical protein
MTAHSQPAADGRNADGRSPDADDSSPDADDSSPDADDSSPDADGGSGVRDSLRRHWQLIALTGWTLLWFLIMAPRGGVAWRFFEIGTRLMFSGPYGHLYRQPGGLHLYSNYPWLQIGPLAFAMAEVIVHLSPDQGLVAGEVIMTGTGLAALYAIKDIALTARPELAGSAALRGSFLAGGAIFMIGWVELAVGYGHLDDDLALLLAVLALLAAVTGHPALTGIAVGLSVDAKPWALIFLPVLLLAAGPARWLSPAQAARPVRRNARGWATAALCTAAVIAAGWLPFFLADHATAAAMHYTIVNLPASALRATGVSAGRTPDWDRSAQVIAGCALGAVAIGIRRWPAVILLGVGARIALDPGAHGYYTAGVLAGALIWDLLGARRPFPLWTVLSFCALNVVFALTRSGPVLGAFRLYLVIAFTAAILLGPARWYWRPPARDCPADAGDQNGATATPSMPGPV